MEILALKSLTGGDGVVLADIIDEILKHNLDPEAHAVFMQQFTTEDTVNLLIQEHLKGVLKDKGSVLTRTGLPAIANNYDSYLIEDENIIVFAYNKQSGLEWLPLNFFVDMSLYETVVGATEKMNAAVLAANSNTSGEILSHNSSGTSHNDIRTVANTALSNSQSAQNIQGYAWTIRESNNAAVDWDTLTTPGIYGWGSVPATGNNRPPGFQYGQLKVSRYSSNGAIQKATQVIVISPGVITSKEFYRVISWLSPTDFTITYKSDWYPDIQTHNTSVTAHSDIRDAVTNAQNSANNAAERLKPVIDNLTYQSFVLLLHPYYAGTMLDGYGFSGRIVFRRLGQTTAFPFIGAVDINTASGYNVNYVNASELYRSTNMPVMTLATCMYNGIRYLCIRAVHTGAAVGSIEMIGNFVNTTKSQIKVVGYYDNNKSTVLNQEINDSLLVLNDIKSAVNKPDIQNLALSATTDNTGNTLDLNDYMTPGVYGFGSLTSPNLLNSPLVGTVPCVLVVFSYSATSCVQMIMTKPQSSAIPVTVYIRQTAGTWSPWCQVGGGSTTLPTNITTLDDMETVGTYSISYTVLATVGGLPPSGVTANSILKVENYSANVFKQTLSVFNTAGDEYSRTTATSSPYTWNPWYKVTKIVAT